VVVDKVAEKLKTEFKHTEEEIKEFKTVLAELKTLKQQEAISFDLFEKVKALRICSDEFSSNFSNSYNQLIVCREVTQNIENKRGQQNNQIKKNRNNN